MRRLNVAFVPGLIISGVLIAVGIAAGASLTTLRTVTYQQVGPAAAPLAVSLALVLAGLLLGWQALTNRWPCEANARSGEKLNVRAAGWMAAGVAACLLCIGTLGFSPAAGLLYACAAQALGGKAPVRSLLVGVLLAAALEFVFFRFLGVQLGDGIFSLSRW